jgi:hypothetical protein
MITKYQSKSLSLQHTANRELYLLSTTKEDIQAKIRRPKKDTFCHHISNIINIKSDAKKEQNFLG